MNDKAKILSGVVVVLITSAILNYFAVTLSIKLAMAQMQIELTHNKDSIEKNEIEIEKNETEINHIHTSINSNTKDIEFINKTITQK